MQIFQVVSSLKLILFLVFPMRITCPAQFVPINLITPKIFLFGKE